MADDKQDPAGSPGMFGRFWERFGEVAKKLGLIGDADVQDALARQGQTEPRKKIGEILVESGRISAEHISTVLNHQKLQRPEAKSASAPSAPAPASAPAAKKAVAPRAKAAAKPVAKKAAASKPPKKAAKAKKPEQAKKARRAKK
jgi:hypothetical protein